MFNHKKIIAGATLLFCSLALLCAEIFAQLPYTVRLNNDSQKGWELLVNGEQVPVNGVVWSFTPIGEDFNYNLWDKDEKFIRKMVDTDGPLLRDMGVTAVRLFSNIPPKWIRYLYRRYGIYTIVNDLMGRYGISVNGKWYPNTDYSMPETRQQIIEQARNTINTYKDVPGVLFFIFGNENNYGLQWKSDAIEDLPIGEQQQERARFLYSLFGEVITASKELTDLPIGIVNGDTQYLQIISEEAPNLDIFGLNIYRGDRAQAIMFESIKNTLNRPILYTEFGADAYNASTKQEDHYNQARFLRTQWQEIYEQSYGKGRSQNMIGGLVFQWQDEWWKYGLDGDLLIHNTEGTWRQPAYYDHVGGANNMNEEWWGIVAQSPRTEDGINVRVPRAAYYLLTDMWKQDFYELTNGEIDSYFAGLQLGEYVARSEAQSQREQDSQLVTVSGSLYIGGRGHFSDDIEIDENGADDTNGFNAIQYSTEQVATLDIAANPLEDFYTEVTLRAQLFALDDALFDSYSYIISPAGEDNLNEGTGGRNVNVERVPIEIYSAAFLYDGEDIDVAGYYHDGIRQPGHADYYLEGDFFNIYPETFDRVGMDLVYSKAPFGVELTTKRTLEGFTLFVGPEIFWGAPPSAYFKFYRQLFNDFYLGLVHYEEFEPRQFDEQIITTPDSFAERKSSLYLGYTLPSFGPVTLDIDAGALIAGTEDIGRSYISADGVERTIEFIDTIAAKGRIDAFFDTALVFNVYGEYTYAGRVANSRGFLSRAGTQIVDSNGSNRHELVAGGNLYIGDFIISPKFRWRTPVDGPHSARNSLTSPFIVWGENRELLQAEIILGYDGTGATWFHQWNNDDRENALFAASVGFLYTFLQGETDAGLALFRDPPEDGVFFYGAWDRGMDAVTDLWRVQARAVSNFAPDAKVIGTLNVGMEQNLGNPAVAPQPSLSAAVDLRLGPWQFGGGFEQNVWGPENWHYEFGFTIPQQFNVLVAYHFGRFSFVEPQNRLGIELYSRTIDGAGEGAGALNTLGETTDFYRAQVTLFYELRY